MNTYRFNINKVLKLNIIRKMTSGGNISDKIQDISVNGEEDEQIVDEQIVNIEHVEAKDNKGIDYDKLISKCYQLILYLTKKPACLQFM